MDDDDRQKRTEQNLIVHSGKSLAEVTNSRRVHSSLRIVLMKLLTDTKHSAASATTGLLVLVMCSRAKLCVVMCLLVTLISAVQM